MGAYCAVDPPAKRGGRKRSVDVREVVNGLMYILSTGCQWRAVPKDLPPRSTLFEYFDLKEEGALIRKAVDASLDENVRTPEIQVEGGAKYGTREVGAWIVDYIKKA